MLTALELTKQLIRYNTINPPGDERDCALFLGEILENEGFKVSYHNFAPNRTSLVAKIENKNYQTPLCFTGHIDVVPLGEKKWQFLPFDCETDNGKLYGRGSSDMKSGVATMVLAAINLKKKANLTLVITAGEEICCQGAHYLAEQEGVLGKAGAIIVGEPTANQAWLGHKGLLWLECTASGTTAHGSMPYLGDNAIYRSIDGINRIKDFDFKGFEHPLLGKPCLNIGTISGGININSVPDKCTFSLDIRTVSGQDNDEVHRYISEILSRDIEIKEIYSGKALASDHKCPWINHVYGIIEEVTGCDQTPLAGTFFTDASCLTPAMGSPPTIIMGPGEPDMAHKTDEFCYTENIDQSLEIYSKIIAKWDGSSQ